MAEQPSMMQMLKQARTMQKQMKTIQKKVEKRDVAVTAADGKIEVVISGKLQVRRILVDQSLIENPDKRVLQDGLVTAVNSAIQKAQNLMSAEMQKMAGEMGLPQEAMNEMMGNEGGDDEAPAGGDDAAGGGRLRRWFNR